MLDLLVPFVISVKIAAKPCPLRIGPLGFSHAVNFMTLMDRPSCEKKVRSIFLEGRLYFTRLRVEDLYYSHYINAFPLSKTVKHKLESYFHREIFMDNIKSSHETPVNWSHFIVAMPETFQ